MSDKQPNIVMFWWDNFGWGELGCYGGGELRGAPTPRIDKFASEGLQLLNFNVEAQCTPSRSALLTGRHAIRSGTAVLNVTGGVDGMTRWETTSAQALSDAGYATGMWGKWHLGSDPEQRSPVDFGFDEAVWCPRTADEVAWTMQSYFPNGNVTAAPYTGTTQIPLEPSPIYARKKGGKSEVIATYDAEFRAGFDRKITDWAVDFMNRSQWVVLSKTGSELGVVGGDNLRLAAFGRGVCRARLPVGEYNCMVQATSSAVRGTHPPRRSRSPPGCAAGSLPQMPLPHAGGVAGVGEGLHAGRLRRPCVNAARDVQAPRGAGADALVDAAQHCTWVRR